MTCVQFIPPFQPTRLLSLVRNSDMSPSKRLLLVALVVALPTLFFLWRFYWLRWSVDRLIISKETTYITEPLDAAGYPDYYAALNERMSRGVTPGNNAAVPLLQAFGPSILPENVDKVELFRHLGMNPLPKRQGYFEDWITYGKRLPPEEIPNLRSETSTLGLAYASGYLFLAMPMRPGKPNRTCVKRPRSPSLPVLGSCSAELGNNSGDFAAAGQLPTTTLTMK